MQTTAPSITAAQALQLTDKIRQATKNIPRQWQWRLYIFALGITDYLMVGLAFRLAYYFRFTLRIEIFEQDAIPAYYYYQTLVFFIIPVWLFIFFITGLYNRKRLLGGTQEYSRLFNGTTVGMLAIIATGFLVPDLVIARGWLIMAWGLAFMLLSLGRFTMRRLIYSMRQHGYFLSAAVIVGANDEGLSLAEQLLSWRTSGIHLIGFLDKKLPVGMPIYKHLTCLGRVEQLDTIIKHHGVEDIILATSAISSRDKMLDIFKQYGVSPEVKVHMSSGLYEIITTGLTVNHFAYVPLVEVNPVRMTGVDNTLKRALDYFITIPGLIALLPGLILVAIAIRLDSPGPIIHRRRVMGVNGRQFDAYKFRTMYLNGDKLLEHRPDLKAELARNHKLKEDPRVTRVGKFLRKFSLDELPQCVNVLIGDMSLVGPRMISPAEIDKYDKWDINLLTVRPGITGVWQVSGRSDITYEERVRLDMYYIRNWSIWLDLQLLLQTLPAVLKSRGAY